MVSIVLALLIIIVGVIIGSWIFTVILLPLFYGLPKATCLARRGILSKSAIKAYLIPIIFWITIFGVALLLIYFVFPMCYTDKAVIIRFMGGFTIGFGVCFWRSFSRKGRTDLRNDFAAFVQRHRNPDCSPPAR